MAQLVKSPPAMRETWVQSLGWEDPLEKGKATYSSILAWRILRTLYIVHGVTESQTRLRDFHFHFQGPLQVQSAVPRGQSHFKGGAAGKGGSQPMMPSAASHHGPSSTHYHAACSGGVMCYLCGPGRQNIEPNWVNLDPHLLQFVF